MDEVTLRVLISRLAFLFPSLSSYINSNHDEKKTKDPMYKPSDVVLLPPVGELCEHVKESKSSTQCQLRGFKHWCIRQL